MKRFQITIEVESPSERAVHAALDWGGPQGEKNDIKEYFSSWEPSIEVVKVEVKPLT